MGGIGCESVWNYGLFRARGLALKRRERADTLAAMFRIILILLAILVVAAVAVFLYFAFISSPPPPSGKIERVIPDSRLPK